jgi:hypothetical protein
MAFGDQGLLPQELRSVRGFAELLNCIEIAVLSGRSVDEPAIL